MFRRHPDRFPDAHAAARGVARVARDTRFTLGAFGLGLGAMCFAACLLAGCRAHVSGGAPVGFDHRPYIAKPAYLAHQLVPTTAPQGLSGRANPLRVRPPEDDDEDADAPRGGSFTVSMPDPAPLPNRITTPPDSWQPMLIVPTHPIHQPPTEQVPAPRTTP